MTQEQFNELRDLLQAILQELRNGGRPKVGVVQGHNEPAPLTVDEAPTRA